MKKTIYTFIAVTLISANIMAQKPAVKNDKKVVIKNATIHVGNGTVLENASIAFDKGVITDIGAKNIDEANATVIDAKGKHVYPGIISADSRLGLEEIEAVRATLDYAEVGDINPNVRSVIAYNTDSRITPTVRSNGVLLALSVPEGGIMPGTSSVMKLDGWNWEDAVYKTDAATQLNWPSMTIRKAWWAPPAEEQRKRSAEEMALIKKFFDEAKAYHELGTANPINLKLEAMKPVFTGQKKLFISAATAKEITSAVIFAKSYGITPVILGAQESYMVADFLREQNVGVIYVNSHSLPQNEDDDVDLPYKIPKLLHDKGVVYCLSINGSWQQRNLPFLAGTTAAYGLTKEQALKSITSNTAKILGIDKTTGTLEVGKDANILISDGDLLDMRTSNVSTAFIKGNTIDLDNVQKALYRKFTEKYK